METYYGIRHIESQKLMPLLERNKGYSHWNPSNKEHELHKKELGVPRLFKSEKQAKQVIRQWFHMPNATYTGYVTPYGEDDYDIIIHPDNRKKEDLEIVEIRIEVCP